MTVSLYVPSFIKSFLPLAIEGLVLHSSAHYCDQTVRTLPQIYVKKVQPTTPK